ncbi:hypothetical protein EJB05_50755 [Eragrostis curvula]|uniref:CWF21 domain-containing protein n=1 Tax=Eragrostis curvula TaxID=38414 RepID=A0A5J9SYW0_9POAL|nr:hypothetical protein EJB05_50755 [Eragrostis curvula]
MYNGVGLQTPRGSGTSGHVQASKFLAKPRPSSSSAAAGGPTGPGIDGGMRKPNKDILEHDRKRQVELRLLELRDALEEQGYTEGEIEERVAEARKAEAAEEGTSPHPGEGVPDLYLDIFFWAPSKRSLLKVQWSLLYNHHFLRFLFVHMCVLVIIGMVTVSWFMDTQSHHAAARKEKQLENLRAALGLDTDDMQKNGIPKAM